MSAGSELDSAHHRGSEGTFYAVVGMQFLRNYCMIILDVVSRAIFACNTLQYLLQAFQRVAKPGITAACCMQKLNAIIAHETTILY